MRDRLAAYFDEWAGIGLLVPEYYLLYAVAVVLGMYLAVREAERDGLNPVSVFRAGLVIVAAAMVGARLFVVAQYWGYYRLHLSELMKIWEGGTASTGAYVGGLLAAFGAAAWYRLPTARFFDCCAPAAAMAIVLGRIGCFLNGCCYGSRSGLPWAVSFPAGAGPYHDHMEAGLISAGQAALPVHPTQLYEAFYGLGIFVLLLLLKRAQKEDGTLTAFLFLAYSFGRFFNEFLRGDERGAVGFFSAPQLLALVMILASGSFFVARRTRMRGEANILCQPSEQRNSIS